VLAVVTVVLWKGAPAIGLVGVISVVVAAGMFTWSVAVIRMARMLGFGLRDLHLFRPVALIAASAAAAALVAALVRSTQAGDSAWMALAVSAPVFGLVYAAGLGLSGVVPQEEIAHLWRDVSRLWFFRRGAIAAAPPPAAEPGPAAAASPRA